MHLSPVANGPCRMRTAEVLWTGRPRTCRAAQQGSQRPGATVRRLPAPRERALEAREVPALAVICGGVVERLTLARCGATVYQRAHGRLVARFLGGLRISEHCRGAFQRHMCVPWWLAMRCPGATPAQRDPTSMCAIPPLEPVAANSGARPFAKAVGRSTRRTRSLPANLYNDTQVAPEGCDCGN